MQNMSICGFNRPASGKLQHVTQHIDTIDESVFKDGLMFDGSSIAGWKAINESDMIMKLDAETAVMDPFYAEPTVAVYCGHLRSCHQ